LTPTHKDPEHFAELLRSGEAVQPYERRQIATLLRRQAEEIAAWRGCAMYSGEGQPNGFRRAKLERCRQRFMREDEPE
jgi:hypothetical protein